MKKFKTILLLLCMTILSACSPINSLTSNRPDDIPVTATRPYEEIVESGITADDVLALYDELAKDCFYADNANIQDKLIADIDEFNNSFVSFSPELFGVYDDYGKHCMIQTPFYYKSDEYDIRTSWASRESGILYNPDSPLLSNVFPINMNIETTLNILFIPKRDDINYTFGVESGAFVDFLVAFNCYQFVVDEEYIFSYEYPFVINGHKGTSVYEPIEITRDVIKNATTEQLWAIYNLVESMYSINFYCELPQPGKDYNFELE